MVVGDVTTVGEIRVDVGYVAQGEEDEEVDLRAVHPGGVGGAEREVDDVLYGLGHESEQLWKGRCDWTFEGSEFDCVLPGGDPGQEFGAVVLTEE